jgi:hypothetical protein
MGDQVMDKVVVALGTLIVSFILFVYLEGEVQKDYAKAGYIVIDKKAYKMTPADSQSRE